MLVYLVMAKDYSYLLIFLTIGAAFVVINCLIPVIVSPRSRGERSQDPYESGEVPMGAAWIQFDIHYYLFCLIFLAFDVEVVLLFPVLVAYKELGGLLPFFEVALFLGIVSFAILYAWKKGVFEWK